MGKPCSCLFKCIWARLQPKRGPICSAPWPASQVNLTFVANPVGNPQDFRGCFRSIEDTLFKIAFNSSEYPHPSAALTPLFSVSVAGQAPLDAPGASPDLAVCSPALSCVPCRKGMRWQDPRVHQWREERQQHLLGAVHQPGALRTSSTLVPSSALSFSAAVPPFGASLCT